MQQIGFSAFGTEWVIQVDHDQITSSLQEKVLLQTQAFELRFSRFIDTSEVTVFRDAQAGTYPVSVDLAVFLHQAQSLKNLTQGRFDPAVGKLLELAGYDQSYSLQPQPELETFTLPDWKIEDQNLTISGPVIFDTGGIGKGYWIDQVAQILKENGLHYFLVDGGGDMHATSKADGAPWRVALEWPGNSERALGIVELKNQGLAISDSLKRNWGEWHHLLDVSSNTSTDSIIWCAALAPTAFKADQMTSVLSLTPESLFPLAASKLSADYVALNKQQQLLLSDDWPGQIL